MLTGGIGQHVDVRRQLDAAPDRPRHEAVVVAGQDDDGHADPRHPSTSSWPTSVVTRLWSNVSPTSTTTSTSWATAASTSAPTAPVRSTGSPTWMSDVCRMRTVPGGDGRVSDDGGPRRRGRRPDRSCTGRRARRARPAGRPRSVRRPNSPIDGVRWAMASYSAPSNAARRTPITSDHRFVTCLWTVSTSSGLSATRWQNAEHPLVELVGRHDVGDQPDALGLGGVDGVPGEQQLLGRRGADLHRHHPERHRDAHAPRRRMAEQRALGSEHDVAGADQVEAAGQAVAVGLGDDRLAVVPHPQPAVDHLAQRLAVAGDRRLAHVGERGAPGGAVPGQPGVRGRGGQVVAGTERPPGAAQADHPHVVAGVERPERGVEVVEQPGAQRVELLGPVEGERGDGTVDVDEQVLVRQVGGVVRQGESSGSAAGRRRRRDRHGRGQFGDRPVAPSSVSCQSEARTCTSVDVEEAERAELRHQVVRVRRRAGIDAQRAVDDVDALHVTVAVDEHVDVPGPEAAILPSLAPCSSAGARASGCRGSTRRGSPARSSSHE